MGTPYPVIPSAVEGPCVSVRLHGTRNSKLSLNSAALLVALCGSIVVSQRRSSRAKAREPFLTRCDRRGAMPLSPLPIHDHFPIHRRSHILPAQHIAKLHHPMSLARQFPPPTRLLRILLNRLILPPIHLELRRLQTMPARLLHHSRLPGQFNLSASDQLFRHQLQNFPIDSLHPSRSSPVNTQPSTLSQFGHASHFPQGSVVLQFDATSQSADCQPF